MMTGYPSSFAIFAARKDRHAGLLHRAAGAGLVAHEANDVRIRSDELDVARLAHFREVGAFRQKSVARVNRVRARNLRRADDGGNVQVAVETPRRSDTHVLVGEPHVQCVLIGLGVDRDGLDTQLAAGPDDSKGDLTAIGDEDLLEHRQATFTAKSRSPYCTGLPFST